MINLEKVYEVKFMRYTTCLNNTVSDWDGKSDNVGSSNYLECGSRFLVKESDLSKYQKYGGGYESIQYVGDIEVE